MRPPPRSVEPSLALINDVLACSSFDNLASELLPRLTAFFGAGSSCAFELRQDGSRLRLGKATQIRMPKQAIADYGAHFVGLDPVCAPTFGLHNSCALRPNQFTIVRLSDRCPRSALLGSEYYNEFLREIDVQHVFGLMVRPESDSSRVVVLGFHRPRSERDFSVELAQAAALGPAFQAAIERMRYRSLIEQLETRTADTACRRWLVSFGTAARLIKVQDAESGTVLFDSMDAAPTYHPALYDALEHGIGSFVVDSLWKSLLADLGVRGGVAGRHLEIARAERVGDMSNYKLTLSAESSVPRQEAWARRIRLTDREMEVTRLVARGLRNADIAQRLGLSLRTVENHLQSIFSKGDVRSRTQLLCLFAGPESS